MCMKGFVFCVVWAACSSVLRSEAQQPESLFNGANLSGWTVVSAGEANEAEGTWRVEDGKLLCSGRPAGYLRTEKEFENYVLTLQWRWPEGSSGGNNGVLVHSTTPNALGIWPRSIEVQLHHQNAGDLWVIGTDLDVENEEQRKQDRRHVNLTDDSEKPIGQWNSLEVTCQGDQITVKVNGELVNHATHCSDRRGAICLQSEGAPIEFRDIQVRGLDE